MSLHHSLMATEVSLFPKKRHELSRVDLTCSDDWNPNEGMFWCVMFVIYRWVSWRGPPCGPACQSSFSSGLTLPCSPPPVSTHKQTNKRGTSITSSSGAAHLKTNASTQALTLFKWKGGAPCTFSSATCDEMCHIRLSLRNFIPYGPRSSDKERISKGGIKNSNQFTH